MFYVYLYGVLCAVIRLYHTVIQHCAYKLTSRSDNYFVFSAVNQKSNIYVSIALSNFRYRKRMTAYLEKLCSISVTHVQFVNLNNPRIVLLHLDQ